MNSTNSPMANQGSFSHPPLFRAIWLALTLLAVSACGGGSDQTSPRVDGENGDPATPNESNRPFAADDIFQVTNDGSESGLDVLNNDIDPNDLSISVQDITTQPDQGGSVSISADGSEVRYTPADGFSGVETFSYSIRNSDGLDSAGPATVRISVGQALITVPPTPVPDVFTVLNDDSVHSLSVLTNDVDINNAIPLTVTAVTSQANGDGMTEAGGTVVIGTDAMGNSIVNYTAPAGFIGPDSFQYTITNTNGVASTTPGIVTIIVSPIAAPPVALPDVFTTVVNSTDNSLNVLSNDVDLAGGGLSITDITPTTTIPAGSVGTFSVGTNAAGDDVIVYTPAAGFIGVETLTYEITDANGTTGTGVVTISVLPVAAPPVALPDVAIAMTNTTSMIDPLLNDVDLSGGGLTITSVSSMMTTPGSAGGTVTTDGTLITYTPPANFIGVETLEYSIVDGNGGTSMSTIVVTVLGVPTAPPPVAVPDVAIVEQNSSANLIDVAGNDIDTAGGGLTVLSGTSMLTIPMDQAGTVTVENGQLSYTPATNFFGVETLNYVIQDSNGTTAMGSVVVTVTPGALIIPPVALPDVATVTTDSSDNAILALANDLDAGMSGGLTITAVSSTQTVPAATANTPTTNGTSISYTPPSGFVGVEILSYTVTDNNGSTAVGSVVITVAPGLAGVPPVAVPDLAVVNQDSGETTINVLANDIDTSMSGMLTLTVDNLPTPGTSAPAGSPGTVSISNNALVYMPAAGFAGVDIIMYTVTDDNGATATGTLAVTVNPLPLPPVALPDVAIVSGDSSNNLINVLNNDVDVGMSGSLTLGLPTSVSTAPMGAVSTIAVTNNMLDYTPEAGFSGVETLMYTVTDGTGMTATAIVVITVSPLPLPPVAIADVAVVEQDSSDNTINVLNNDVDVAMTNSLTVSVDSATPGTTAPAGSPGTVTVNMDGTLNYTPVADFTGVDVVPYTITDGNGMTAMGVLTITVSPLPLPPITVPDTFGDINPGDAALVIDLLANDLITSGPGTIRFPGTPSTSTPPTGLPGLATTAVLGSPGSLSLSADGTTLTYTPPGAGTTNRGVVTFSYIARDANGVESLPTLVVLAVGVPIPML